MNYSAMADRNASDTRKMWQDAWDAMVIGKRTFTNALYMTEKTIYCVKNYNKSPFMVTDRTTGMMIYCQTIDEARKAFGRIQSKMLANGWAIGKEAA